MRTNGRAGFGVFSALAHNGSAVLLRASRGCHRPTIRLFVITRTVLFPDFLDTKSHMRWYLSCRGRRSAPAAIALAALWFVRARFPLFAPLFLLFF